MDAQTTTRDNHIVEEFFLTLSLEELEKIFSQIDASLEQTFQKVLRPAQEGAQIEAQRRLLIGLENRFEEGRQELKAVVDALIHHAIFGAEDDQT